MTQKKKSARIIKKNTVEPPATKPTNFGSVPLLFVAAVLSGVLTNATFGVINQ
jgi:hypothetical protein